MVETNGRTHCLQASSGTLSWWHVHLAGMLLLLTTCGCLSGGDGDDSWGRVDRAWGRRGTEAGRFQKPRAMTLDARDQLYVVDMTARIQVFDLDGNFLRQWRTPDNRDGKPTGLSVARDGRLLVADTHYFRVLIYSPEGVLLRTIGGSPGGGPGEFGLVSDVVEDSQGFFYVAEYGQYHRIQKFTSDGQFVLQWGGPGSEPGRFSRPQNMVIDAEDRIWVVDACNHRVQVFDPDGKLVKVWGEQGGAAGELYYPYDLALAEDGTVFVVEFGNHRVQRFTEDGQSLGCWGTHGRQAGELHNPWALVLDRHGRLHVLDTNNHRVQRVRM